MRTIVFDLDGTLADTSGDLIAAANVCLDRLGVPGLDPVRDRATALRGGRAMLTLGLSRVGAVDPAILDQYYPVLLDAYDQKIDRHSYFFDGALDAVQILRDRGDRVAICTNKPEGLAEKLMRNLNARDMFHALIGADTLPTRKPDVAPYIAAVERAGGDVSRSVMIGDTITDHTTARNIGVPSVLVDFGLAEDDIYQMQPDAVLKQFSQLPDIIDDLLP